MINMQIVRAALAGAALGVMMGAPAAGAAVLSDNTAATSNGSEAATGLRWIAASFTTDTGPYTLDTVSLVMSGTAGASAEVSIYSDGGLEPGLLLGTLTPPAAYPATLAPTVFTSGGLALAAGRTYWVVLRPISGTLAWSWTNTNTGTGAGFTHTWGASDDAGSSWWTDDIYPAQFAVNATVPGSCTNPAVSQQPASQGACLHGPVTLSVAASGATGYQWRKGGVSIGGATGAQYTIASAVGSSAGSYDAVLTNACGTTTSAAATVSVCIADFNCAGSVSVQDIFDFLGAYFAGGAGADVNESGDVSVQDIFDFLVAYFAGCS